MDNFRGFGSGKVLRKQRTNLFRRPQNESQSPLDCLDNSSTSSTPSDNLTKASSHDNFNYSNISRTSFNNLSNAETAVKPGVEDGQIEDLKLSGTVMCNNHSGPLSDGAGNDNKLKKVKLKVGGVTRTIHTISVTGSSSTNCSSFSDTHQSWQPKENIGGKDPSYTGKAIGLRGIPWKDFAKTGFSIRRVESPQDRLPGSVVRLKQFGKYEAAHESKHVLKMYNDEDVEEDDDEIRYLEKLKFCKYSASCSAEFEDEDDDELRSKKLRKVSRVLSQTSSDCGADFNDKAGKGIKKPKLARESQDSDYEEAVVSDTELEPKKKKHQKEFTDFSVDGMAKMAVTTRQRALYAGKDISSSAGGFPHGLPPPPPKKQKEQLSEVEQQLKKAEAAQRRKIQAEKAARESEAEAIRKILGQDSSRKKREDKLKKRQEELAQERMTCSAIGSNAIRWVMGPSGTVVTFPSEMGLPSIFEPKACSYPPPREKCAGPSCMNTYKYRDSKSKLPLCSLQCYKAIREKIQPLSAC